jgi:hypothetical protein
VIRVQLMQRIQLQATFSQCSRVWLLAQCWQAGRSLMMRFR